MTRMNRRIIPDLHADPFGERTPMLREHLRLLGARFQFQSNSRQLLHLVESAYDGLPRHRLSAAEPRLRVRLQLMAADAPSSRRGPEPPPLTMISGAGFLGGATQGSSFVIVSQQERSALVGIAPQMLRFPYHTRYELIEFAVFSLAQRVQGLVSLHAACVGLNGRGVLLMGPSGAGKSTLALLCLLQGLDFLSEDAVFIAPASLLATGIANFLHVTENSLRWVERDRDAAAIRRSPVIRRRSGVKKFELDLRRRGYRLAPAPLRIGAVIFLSRENAGAGPLVRPLTKAKLVAALRKHQAYAANQPEWPTFEKHVCGLDAFELRRGRHPREAVNVLRALLGKQTG
jgi:energy-coupling factor transporter ATP-binding protein EcfA2